MDFSYQKKKYRQMITCICKRFLNHPITYKNMFQSICKNNDCVLFDQYNNIMNRRQYFFDNVFIGTYIKTAIDIIERCQISEESIDTSSHAIWLNKKWCQLLSSFVDNTLVCSIPIVDISLDISNESLYHAIGFACLVAIKSGVFRILLVSTMPIWIETCFYM